MQNPPKQNRSKLRIQTIIETAEWILLEEGIDNIDRTENNFLYIIYLLLICKKQSNLSFRLITCRTFMLIFVTSL